MRNVIKRTAERAVKKGHSFCNTNRLSRYRYHIGSHAIPVCALLTVTAAILAQCTGTGGTTGDNTVPQGGSLGTREFQLPPVAVCNFHEMFLSAIIEAAVKIMQSLPRTHCQFISLLSVSVATLSLFCLERTCYKCSSHDLTGRCPSIGYIA